MVYVFLANGFEEIEALSVVDILRRAEINTKTVGIGGNIVTGAHGIIVNADILLSEVKCEDIAAVVLPGGMPGTTNLMNSVELSKIITFAAQNNKCIAAICAAPSVIGSMGLLKGKKAVCYPGFEKELLGAKIQDLRVCVDGNIITAIGPGAAMDFGLELVKTLKNEKMAEEIYLGMKCY